MDNTEELIKIIDDKDGTPVVIKKKVNNHKESDYYKDNYMDSFDINYRPPDYHPREDIELFKI